MWPIVVCQKGTNISEKPTSFICWEAASSSEMFLKFRLHGVTTQKTVIFKVTAARKSNFM